MIFEVCYPNNYLFLTLIALGWNIENEDTVFLSATIVGDDDISIIDTIPGLFTVEFSNTQWYECFKGAWQTKDKRWDFSNYKIPTLVL